MASMARTKLSTESASNKFLGIVSKLQDPISSELTSKIVNRLHKGQNLILETQALGQLPTKCRKLVKTMSIKDLVRSASAILVIGGDGTILRAARYLLNGQAYKSTGLIGVNTGHLGFLASINEKEASKLSAKDFKDLTAFAAEDHSCLRVELLNAKSKRVLKQFDVMNDVVLSKGSLSRIFEFHIDLNGQLLSSYRADGLVVSPPTGSTAYNLAAGGSIIQPGVPAIQLTPIAAQYFSNKPIVVSDENIIDLYLGRHSADVFLTLDGHSGLRMEDEHVVRIKKSPKFVRFFVPKSKQKTHYFDSLRQKLNWGLVSDTRA